jgi:hypothetical protein
VNRVSPADGACQPILKAVPGSRYAYPLALPGGKHFLYTRVADDESLRGVYAASLDGNGPEHRVLADQTAVFLSSPGGTHHLLFRRDATLLAVRFDLAQLVTMGDPFPVAQGISASSNVQGSLGGVSADGLLVYVSNQATGGSQLHWLERSGKDLGVIGTLRGLGGIALHPDGVSAAVRKADPSLTLRQVDLATGQDTQLAPVFGSVAGWSPDGRRIAYTSKNSIVARDASGGPETVLVTSPNPIRVSDWSRNGKVLFYTEQTPANGGDILYVDPATPGAKPVPFLATKANESQAQLSHDGRWVMYSSEERGAEEVFVRSFPRGEGPWVVGAGQDPRWSVDGREVFLRSAQTSNRRSALMVATFAGAAATPTIGKPRTLFEAPLHGWASNQNAYSYAPSPDGKRFLVQAFPETTARPAIHAITQWWVNAREKGE